MSGGRGILSAFLSAFFVTGAIWAADVSIPVPPTLVGQEAMLEVSYRLVCDETRESYQRLRMAPGTVSFDGRRIRLDLFEERDQARAQLGRISTGRELRLLVDDSGPCRFQNLLTTVLPLRGFVDDSSEKAALQVQVLKHSPFVVVRPNQYANRYTDLPLAMVYSTNVLPDGTRRIRYTAYFSDEDLITIGTDREEMMARYGRRSDIEWVYQVELSPTGEVLRRTYHSALFFEIGHSETEFRGTFLPGTEHPVIYNVQDNNVFSEFPKSLQRRKLEGHHLVPDSEVEYPEARERFQLSEPWSFRISDLENHREGRRVTLASQYLYAVVRGHLESGAFNISVRPDSGTWVEGGGGAGDIDRLGEDMWHRETMSGIPLGVDVLRGIEGGTKHGLVRLVSASIFRPKVTVREMRFYRLVRRNGRYETVDLTERFDCSYGGLGTLCRF